MTKFIINHHSFKKKHKYFLVIKTNNNDSIL